MKRLKMDWFADVKPFRHDPLNFLLNFDLTKTEPLEKLRLGPQPVYLLTDPELVKPILRFPETQVDKGRLIKKLRSVIGDSVVILSGEEHKRRRGVLHGMMARGNLESLAPLMSAEIRRCLASAVRAGGFDAHQIGSTLALRLICITAFGKNVLSETDEQALVQSVRLIEDDVADEIFRVFPLSPWAARKRNQRREASRVVMKRVVKKVREEVGTTGGLEEYAKLGLSDEALADEVLTLLLAGHHTTGAAVAWLLHALATEPGLAEKISAEASLMTDLNGEIDASKLPGARTTMATVREVTRLFPSSWWFSRETIEETKIGGRTLKPKTSILLSPWLFHRSAYFWEEPDRFKLDRGYNNPAYLPFGAGPRACVGMTLATFELQLIAMECASSLVLEFDQVARPEPEAQVMLMPPSMLMKTTPKIERLSQVA